LKRKDKKRKREEFRAFVLLRGGGVLKLGGCGGHDDRIRIADLLISS